jgi:glycosyltransferase involved in cell wall biosynthesis
VQQVRLSVVAPMHNEEGNARALYEGVRDALDRLGEPYEIIFVNDASSDATLSVMKEIAGRDGRFHYADLESNAGENWALFAGISKAAGEVIVTIDGDYQNDPGATIPGLSRRFGMAQAPRRKFLGPPPAFAGGERADQDGQWRAGARLRLRLEGLSA